MAFSGPFPDGSNPIQLSRRRNGTRMNDEVIQPCDLRRQTPRLRWRWFELSHQLLHERSTTFVRSLHEVRAEGSKAIRGPKLLAPEQRPTSNQACFLPPISSAQYDRRLFRSRHEHLLCITPQRTLKHARQTSVRCPIELRRPPRPAIDLSAARNAHGNVRPRTSTRRPAPRRNVHARDEMAAGHVR